MDTMCAIMSEEKKPEIDKITIKHDTLRKYFPKSYTPKQMEDTIIKLLDQWQQKQKTAQMHIERLSVSFSQFPYIITYLHSILTTSSGVSHTVMSRSISSSRI